MHPTSTFAIATAIGLISSLASTTLAQNDTPKMPSIQYPPAPRDAIIDDYHGTPVADPYRWLEDTESEQTAAWVAAENKITRTFLDQIPERTAIRDRLTELWNYERFTQPRSRQSTYFYTHNSGLQNQSLLYVAEGLDAPRRVLIDPNKLSEDGTMALAGWSPTDDGSLLAYSIADGGSDWRTWRVRDVASGEDRDDVVRWVKFSGIAWMPDNSGFFYGRYAEPSDGEELTGTNYNQQLYFHKLGTDQSEDRLIYERPDNKEWGFTPEVTEDGRYLIITNWKGSEPQNQIFIQPLGDPKLPVTELIGGFDAEYSLIGNDESILYFLTDNDAPRRRVIAVDADDPRRDQWREVIPQNENVIEDCSLLGEEFFTTSMKDALSQIDVYNKQGEVVKQIELPGLGSAGGFGGQRDATETFYSFTNYVTPPSIFRYDLKTGESTLWRAPELNFDASRFVTKQVFYESKDGTRVPMIITHRADLKLDGSNPTLLYAYGGFNISLTPGFSPAMAVWMDRGGIYAVPNLRGGGEYGRSWHEAGMQEKKQNVFDDFIAAAEYLIQQNYTCSDKLAIRGGSNGGLLVGAVMTQRPELFGACLPAVGVMDMLRFHKFTIGWAWVTEFGSSDDPEQFKTLLNYSPLHQIKPGTCYPPTLITTADRDDRVVPGHSFKFAAALQAAQSCDNPTLIRIETRAGHGAGTPVTKYIDQYADLWAFLTRVLQ
ncbi:Prolyl endopeptidase precursor [Rosistilla ulvae]|uniref:prolyl oligopeptidase n=1 Tax=Rosistilla ulvae TaxID=1930277 RepID=A0A517M6X6_9BACT|nr:Prolyl endopeptidase precursor [Rosistilla ulvae]